MKTASDKNAPNLAGWAIALGMGAVAFAVAKIVGEMSTPASVAIGIIVALLAGLILGMPWGAKAETPAKAATPVAKDMPVRAVPAATAVAQSAPMPAPVPAPAPAPAPVPASAPAPVAVIAPVPAMPEPVTLVAAPAPVAVVPTPAAALSPAVEGRRPEALQAARDGNPDDLKIIKGIGPKLEKLCHTLGFFHFDQVANWKIDEIAWVDQNLEGFKGRVTRDRWVPQAKAIVNVGPAEFLRRLDAGEEF